MLGALAEMGAIFLLFKVGLEMRPRQLLQVGRTASLVALLGVVFPFVLGFFYMKHAGHQPLDSIFLAAAMVATSVGITARVLQDTNALETSAARVILAAAVLDDILGMMVLALVTSVSAGPIPYLQLAIVAAEAIGFSLFTIILGSRIMARLHPAMAKFSTGIPPLLCPLRLAWASRSLRFTSGWPRSSVLFWPA